MTSFVVTGVLSVECMDCLLLEQIVFILGMFSILIFSNSKMSECSKCVEHGAAHTCTPGTAHAGTHRINLQRDYRQSFIEAISRC